MPSFCGCRWSGLVQTRASGGFQSVSSRYRSSVLGCQSAVVPAYMTSRPCGCSCCCAACMASVVSRRVRVVEARLALDSLAVVFLMWRTLAGKSRCGAPGRLRRILSALLLRLGRCSVCRVASLVERCDTCLWLLSA
ncbi:hypothetical protein Taro_028482 [Colocasia esculenta]|uniref:Uncharacterized protein n=1 Tax=Colocasia esculenta TaxID=4460 RepID=A0A843VQI4_COLES|nr:hypothetical protein [Colocasia esculenta]